LDIVNELIFITIGAMINTVLSRLVGKVTRFILYFIFLIFCISGFCS